MPLAFGSACQTEGMVPAGFVQEERRRVLAADLAAVRTLVRAGFDADGLARYIERVEPRVAIGPLLGKEERVARMRAEMAKLPPSGDVILTTGAFEAAREEVRRMQPRNPPVAAPSLGARDAARKL
jgi:predicted Zn-dependent protease